MRSIYLIIVCAFTGLPAQQLVAAHVYSIVDLGVAGESAAGAIINNLGQIAITLNLQSGDTSNQVLFLDNAPPVALITLGGQISGLSDINESGTIVGSSQSIDGRRHAVVYSGGVLQDWGTLGELGSVLAAINDSGIIVGDIRDKSTSSAVIFNAPNDITHLGTLGGSVSSVSDINNIGQIVGISLTGEPFVPGPTVTLAQEAFLYENGQMVGLGSLGGHTSNALGINDAGQIVGDSVLPNGESHAFIYDTANGMQDLGTSGQQSFAHDINELGTIIGGLEVTPGNWRAAIFDELTGPVLLQELIPTNSGWLRLNSASDINDLGQIVGTGIINNEQHTFLLTPIPEPKTSWLLLVAASSIALCRWR